MASVEPEPKSRYRSFFLADNSSLMAMSAMRVVNPVSAARVAMTGVLLLCERTAEALAAAAVTVEVETIVAVDVIERVRTFCGSKFDLVASELHHVRVSASLRHQGDETHVQPVAVASVAKTQLLTGRTRSGYGPAVTVRV